MFSEMAKRDIEKLREGGYSPADAEIVELNDLAVQIQHGKDTTAANHPRFAFAGNVVLHEPTVAALAWWWTFGHDAFRSSRDQLLTHYFMLANSRRPEILDALERPPDVRRAVRKWSKGVYATSDELFRAMMFAKHGYTYTLPKETKGELLDPIPDAEADKLNSMVVLAAGQSGISIDALRTRTCTELMALIRITAKAGCAPKPSVARLYIKYQSLIREIEARCRAEVNDGE